jgi:hypothetical protein
MLIFKNESGIYIHIHIPKNGGTYIRNKIINDNKNEIISNYWDVVYDMDLAHIPYMKRTNYIRENVEYNYFAYSRNPYDRLISAFFYKNRYKKCTLEDFKYFIKNEFAYYTFSNEFKSSIIHYYPQYLFICDESFNILKNIKIKKLELCENPRRYKLVEFFDNDCLKIVNRIYKIDFLEFDYEMIDSLEQLE